MSEPLGDVATRVLFENEMVKVWEMTLAPGEASALHRHERPYLMCIVEGARIDAEQLGKGQLQIPVQPGSVLFVPPVADEPPVEPPAKPESPFGPAVAPIDVWRLTAFFTGFGFVVTVAVAVWDGLAVVRLNPTGPLSEFVIRNILPAAT